MFSLSFFRFLPFVFVLCVVSQPDDRFVRRLLDCRQRDNSVGTHIASLSSRIFTSLLACFCCSLIVPSGAYSAINNAVSSLCNSSLLTSGLHLVLALFVLHTTAGEQRQLPEIFPNRFLHQPQRLYVPCCISSFLELCCSCPVVFAALLFHLARFCFSFEFVTYGLTDFFAVLIF